MSAKPTLAYAGSGPEPCFNINGQSYLMLTSIIAAVPAKSLAGATKIWNGSLRKADVRHSAATMPHGDTILWMQFTPR